SAASIVQITGRFTLPSLSDRIGRKLALFSVFAIMAVAVAMLVATSGTVYAVAFCILSFAYGGGVTAMPAIVSDRLGSANATQNIAFSELETMRASFASFGLVNTFATDTSIVISGIGSCLMGAGVLLAIYGIKPAGASRNA
ncbi:MAG: hypothetical protein IJ131_08550, partial [Eggerthellaceae bacterium]|nr:hypothetical protein [Eggerthellaceae bacterium]